MSPQSTRVLLVGDEGAFTGETRSLLQENADVTWVTSGERALDLLLTGDWNVLVTEVELPGLGGIEVVRASRSRDPEPVAILLCGDERLEDAVEAMRAGASDYLARPVMAKELAEKVSAAGALDAERRRRRAPSERVLAIGAHPDDIEIGCAGALLRHRDAGQAITLLTMSAGEAGGDRGVRTAEAECAARLLSARLYILDFEDTEIAMNDTTVSAISDIVAAVRPTTVYTHSAHDLHQDHRSVHFASLIAARSVPCIYSYQSPSATVDFRPTRFVSVDDVLERKLAMIEPYRSQTEIRGYLAPDLLRATARYWGRFASSEHAEPLEVIRESDLPGERPAASTDHVLTRGAPVITAHMLGGRQ